MDQRIRNKRLERYRSNIVDDEEVKIMPVFRQLKTSEAVKRFPSHVENNK
jgi:hypothetical protein